MLSGNEVEDEDVVEDGLEDLDKGLVGVVRAIDLEAGHVLEADDKAMSEAFGAVLRADVGAPLEAGDGVDLPLEGCKFLFDVLNLGGRGIFFELKTNDVAKRRGCFGFSGRCFFVMIGHGENWDEGGERDDDCFHGAAV